MCHKIWRFSLFMWMISNFSAFILCMSAPWAFFARTLWNAGFFCPRIMECGHFLPAAQFCAGNFCPHSNTFCGQFLPAEYSMRAKFAIHLVKRGWFLPHKRANSAFLAKCWQNLPARANFALRFFGKKRLPFLPAEWKIFNSAIFQNGMPKFLVDIQDDILGSYWRFGLNLVKDK